MRWCCFQFWFVYRLVLACLSHFNWLTSIYVNCIYFICWKSYDLLWFWMHLILCICFKPLRTENYLIVWCNLIRKRCTTYPNSTYKEIYMTEYGKLRKSKVEQELDKISEAEASDVMNQEEESSDEDNGNDKTSSNITHLNYDEKAKKRALSEAIRREEQRECMEQVFLSQAVPSTADMSRQYNIDADEARPVPPPRLKTHAKRAEMAEEVIDDERLSSWTRVRQLSIRELLGIPFRYCRAQCAECLKHCAHCGEECRIGCDRLIHCRWKKARELDADGMGFSRASSESDVSLEDLSSRIKKYIPLIRTRRTAENKQDVVMDTLKPDFTNSYDLKTAKQMQRREKRDRRALKKRLRARRRAELAFIAKEEARQKTISNAIELLLQLLRMVTSFAILVGNIRKTFIPAQFKWLKPGRHAYDNPELMMLWRCTVFLDVLLFWTNVIWAYCLQWHLCCRLGLFKFWMWTIILMIVAGAFMFYPMSYVQQNLDISWCRFKPNSTLAKFQPNW